MSINNLKNNESVSSSSYFISNIYHYKNKREKGDHLTRLNRFYRHLYLDI